MSKAIRVNDREWALVQLEDGFEHLQKLIGGYFEFAWVNGPHGLHPNHVVVGLAMDEMGGPEYKNLPLNRLATSFWGVFATGDGRPIVGPVVIIGTDAQGEAVDVPDWTIRLITAIKHSTDDAYRYHGNPGSEMSAGMN